MTDEIITTEEETTEVDATTEEETTEEESEDESTEDSTEDEASHSDNEIDYEAELEKEEKGKPDPKKAAIAFKKREKEREEDEDESDDDRPLTKRDLAAVKAQVRQELLEKQAEEIAKRMTGSDKEAKLVIAKWRNRTFPENLSIEEQLEESYVITHKNKLLGERKELARALASKDRVNRNPATAHRDAPEGKEPKLSSADASAIKAAGFTFNGTTRRYEKRLANGTVLVRDPKTGSVSIVNKK